MRGLHGDEHSWAENEGPRYRGYVLGSVFVYPPPHPSPFILHLFCLLPPLTFSGCFSSSSTCSLTAAADDAERREFTVPQVGGHVQRVVGAAVRVSSRLCERCSVSACCWSFLEVEICQYDEISSPVGSLSCFALWHITPVSVETTVVYVKSQ